MQVYVMVLIVVILLMLLVLNVMHIRTISSQWTEWGEEQSRKDINWWTGEHKIEYPIKKEKDPKEEDKPNNKPDNPYIEDDFELFLKGYKI
jgi:hypothetical protein